MIMIATYERGMKLNVRQAPNALAPVVRTMASGEQAECLEVRDGWAKLKDGYVNAGFVVVKMAEAVKESVPEEAPEHEVQELVAPEQDQDEASELRKMTNKQLHYLAEQSGIEVKNGAKKEELIAAILADE